MECGSRKDDVFHGRVRSAKMSKKFIDEMREEARNNLAVEREEKEIYVTEQIQECTDVELDAVVSQLETYKRRRVE